SRIVRPLTAAARVADRIARGELQTPIPPGGADETGILLNSMTVMQDNIRRMMARETALRLSAENRLTDALESSNEGVLLSAPGGEIVLANSSLRAFFPALCETLVPGTNFEAALAAIQTELASGTQGVIDIGGHAELQLASGHWLRLTGSATSEGGTILFFSDFTAVKEREESLRKAKQEAEAANEAKNRFLANMSHELRTPLNAIIGFSEMMTGAVHGPMGATQYNSYASDINASARHLLAIINDILEVAKIEAGRFNLVEEETSVADLCAIALKMVRERAEQRGVLLRSEVGPALPNIIIDQRAMRQVLLNLLSNAVKFTKASGEVTLRAQMAMDGELMLQVCDTGIGMREDDLNRVLQPFVQVENEFGRKFEGTGLGLSLSKQLIELHGGRLGIVSKPDFGTTVTAYLPPRRLAKS
ncbi:MAG TPA: ATP-binding protein, partial [Dongiaceae bacterium]|nr:ATP-binding protein [Dongiaceae bacterium]